MFRFILKSEKGQTALEYLLLIACSVSLGLLFLKKMNEYVIKNPNGLIGGPINQISNILKQDASGRYKRYSLPPYNQRRNPR